MALRDGGAMLRWVVGTVALLAFACADTSTLEERVSALEAAGAVVVERLAEVTPPTSDEWWVIDRDRVVADEFGISVVEFPAHEVAWRARFRLHISDPSVQRTYDVLVPSSCFDAVRVGDAWPSEHPECR